MASITLPRTEQDTRADAQTMTMPEAAKLLSREERFMATVAAMNTLLIEKGVYTQEEFDAIYIQWAVTQQSRPKKQRPGWRSRILSILSVGA
ncbi:MAG TPA: hypothetical protein VG488_09965 [Candidatus Angelobacter sp.]|jgi:hypothetical protein|nr:hypothetical protein [Candidatus Angelobacter sp.]